MTTATAVLSCESEKAHLNEQQIQGLYMAVTAVILFFTAGKKGKVKSKNLIKQLAQQPGNYCSCCAL